MQKPLLVGALCALLAGCAQSMPPSANDPVASLYTFRDEEALYRDGFALSEKGKAAMPKFLGDLGLGFASSLYELGGQETLTQSMCEKLYAAYNSAHPAEKLSVERCGWNIATDEGGYVDHGSPLVFAVGELVQGRYLVLFIDEEGLGGAHLASATYDLAEQKTTLLDRSGMSDLGGTTVYARGTMLYFVSNGGPCKPETDSCARQLEAAYDLMAGKFVLTR